MKALDAGEHRPPFLAAQADGELEELLRFRHLLGSEDPRHAEIDLRKVVDRALGGEWLCGKGLGGIGGHGGVSGGRKIGRWREGRRWRGGLRRSHEGLELGRLDPAGEGLERGDRHAGEGVSRFLPGKDRASDECAGLGSQVRQHRRQVDDDLAEEIQRHGGDVAELLGRFGARLGELPGLLGIDVGVGPVGGRHHQPHGAGEVAVVVGSGDLGAVEGPLSEQPAVVGVGLRQPRSLEPPRCPAGEVHHLTDEVGVHLGGEVLEVEVDVVDVAGELCRVVIAEAGRIEVVEVGPRQEEGAAALRHFLAVDGEKAVDPHLRRQGKPGRFEHRRPEEGVEVGDVLADEVVDLSGRFVGAAAVPPRLPGAPLGRRPLVGGGDVADRRVEPHIPVMPRRIGDLEAEVGGRAGDVPVAEWLAEEMAGEVVGDPRVEGPGVLRPFAEEALHRLKLDEEMLGRADFGGRAGKGADGIDEIGWRVGGVALLAGVAVLVSRLAARAGAADEAVGEEHPCLRIEELLDVTADDETLVTQAPPDFAAEAPVGIAVGAAVMVELDPEAGEVSEMILAHRRDQLALGAPLCPGPDHDCRAVGVVSAEIDGLVAAELLEADEDIRLDVLDQVPEVDLPVGIRERRGHEDPAECRGIHGGRAQGGSDEGDGESTAGVR